MTGRSEPVAASNGHVDGRPPGVVAVTAHRLAIPLRRPFVTSAGTWEQRETWLLRLVDERGREGVGEACLDPAAGPDALERLDALVRTVVPGLVAPDGSGPMNDPAIDVDPIGRAVRSALEAALVDLGVSVDPATGSGPKTGGPVPGAPTRSVPVNATIATEDRDDAVEAAVAAVGAGFDTLKLKGGGEPSAAELVGRLQAVRDAVGPSVVLRLDVNGAWHPATARERLTALGDLGLAYVEQPIAPGDPVALAALRTDVPVAIAVDESVESVQVALELLHVRAADVLVVKPVRVGGLAGAATIVHAAARAGVPVVVSTLLETGVGIAAALRVAALATAVTSTSDAAVGTSPLAHGLATGGVLVDDLLETPLTATAGRMVVPDGPGLGIRIDRAAVDRWATDVVEASR